jgi:hypothetical protein
MKTKRFRIVLVILVVAMLGVSAWQGLRLRDLDPFYQGKRLSVWTREYEANERFRFLSQSQNMAAQATPARNAIRELGTNALPSLLRWAGDHDSVFKLQFRKVADWTGSKYLVDLRMKMSPDEYHYQAELGFEALGPEAKPAVPALIHLLGDRDDEVRIAALHGLRGIGPAAKAAVPALLGCIQQTNTTVRYFAVFALGTIHEEPGSVIPVLIEVVKADKGRADTNIGTTRKPGTSDLADIAIFALGNYGTEAKAAVPTILPCLSHSITYVRKHATNALKEIDAEAAAKAGVK